MREREGTNATHGRDNCIVAVDSGGGELVAYIYASGATTAILFVGGGGGGGGVVCAHGLPATRCFGTILAAPGQVGGQAQARRALFLLGREIRCLYTCMKGARSLGWSCGFVGAWLMFFRCRGDEFGC